MKRKYYKAIDYKHLFLTTVKEKYFNLILGMIVSFVISGLAYNYFLKDTFIKASLILPKFKTQTVSPTTIIAKPEKTYIVQEGDDLWHIAEKFYGSGFNAYDISLANKIDPNTSIETGQKLVIPDSKRRQATVGDISSASTSQVTYTEDKYVVQPGDSLSSISLKVYGDLYLWPRILQANNFQNPDQIEVGMVLTIPR